MAEEELRQAAKSSGQHPADQEDGTGTLKPHHGSTFRGEISDDGLSSTGESPFSHPGSIF